MADDRTIEALEEDFCKRNRSFIRIVSECEDGVIELKTRHGKITIEKATLHGKKDQ